jgi:hypothetical protein
LAARHSFREAAQLLSTLLPCVSTNHATIRNRTHRIAAEIEAKCQIARKSGICRVRVFQLHLNPESPITQFQICSNFET